MQNKQEFISIIEKAIKDYDLYGRSFTYGLALYKLIEKGLINERMDVYGIYDQMEMYVGDDLLQMMDTRNLDTSMRGLSYIMDIAVLQEIVENLIEEE